MNNNETPAFPLTEGQANGSGRMGMSLRDYFAAKAMQSMNTQNNSNPNTILVCAENAYRWADAMMKVRR